LFEEQVRVNEKKAGLQELVQSADLYFRNTVYHKVWVDFQEKTGVARVQCSLIYPATQAQIDKYSAKQLYLVRETSEIYSTLTKPLFIDKIDHAAANEWMYAILEGRAETELKLFENERFVLSKDWEFNGGDVQTLYCLAMPKQRDLLTLRDLRREHLPLLKEMLDLSM